MSGNVITNNGIRNECLGEFSPPFELPESNNPPLPPLSFSLSLSLSPLPCPMELSPFRNQLPLFCCPLLVEWQEGRPWMRNPSVEMTPENTKYEISMFTSNENNFYAVHYIELGNFTFNWYVPFHLAYNVSGTSVCKISVIKNIKNTLWQWDYILIMGLWLTANDQHQTSKWIFFKVIAIPNT